MISMREHIPSAERHYRAKEIMPSSFLQLFEQYRGMLYAISLRMLGHGEDAKDAVQETFIKAYTHLNTLHDKTALGGWLKSIVYNHCLMELRYRKRKVKALDTYIREKEIFEDAECNIEKAPEEIKNTLAGLSEALQLTSMLRFFSKNSSYHEIASILDVPVGTVRSRLAESRTRLASLIAQQNPFEKSNRAKEMEDFYQLYFPACYDNPSIRNTLLNHFDKQVFISFTSGKTVIGSNHVKDQIEFDLKYGARATIAEVHSSGNISILELSNINPPENPDLCPLSSTFIFVHPKNKVEKAFLHHASMPPNEE
jgi:RNA polymerase sigma-70 factor (ECF subfamily)